MKKYIVFFILLFPSALFSQELPNNYDKIKEQINTIQNDIENLRSTQELRDSKLNDELKSEASSREIRDSELKDRLKSGLKNIDTRLNDIELRIGHLDNTILVNLYRSKLGAIILLVGLILETIGAILLSGNNLVNKIEKIRSVKIETGLFDLSMENIVQKSVLGYLSGIGSIALVFGFMLQFTGTLLVISQAQIQTALFLVIGIIVPITIVFYLTGQNPDQSRKEKIAILIFNIRITFFNSICSKLLPKSITYCDICGEFLKSKNGEIWFLQEKQTKEHNSLHKPHNIQFGHEKCLCNDPSYEEDLKTGSLMDALNTNSIHKMALDEFLNINYSQLKNWFKDNKADWQKKKEKEKGYKDHYELELDNLYKRLKPK